MRENTALGEGKLYTKAMLNTLAKNNFTTTNASTGFDLNLAKQVPNLVPKVMKAKVSVTPMKKSNKAQKSKSNSLRQCEECDKKKNCTLETFRGTKSPIPALLNVSHQVWHKNQPVLLCRLH